MTQPLALADAQARRAQPRWMRSLLGALSPAGERGRLSILIFHRVRPGLDELFPDEEHADSFRERMLWVRDWFNVLPLEEAVAALGRRALPARALAITFDDGYADNATVAVPIMRQLGLHATFFVATEFVEGGRMWNDTVIEAVRRAHNEELDLSELGLGRPSIATMEQRRQVIERLLTRLKYLPAPERQTRVECLSGQCGNRLPDDLMMTRGQLRSVASAGMGFGGHTCSHPILARLDDGMARREIAEGREALEAIVRQPVRLFAYPNGKPRVDYTGAHVRMAKELGFVGAVSTAPGAVRTGDPVYELPRFTAWGRTPLPFGIRMAKNLLRKVAVA